MNISFNTSEVRVLEDFFNDLSNVNQRKVFISAFKKAVKPLISLAKLGAPMGATGNLRRSIGSIATPRDISILVGARKGRYKGWHAHFIENGTMARFRRSGGSTGKIISKPFFEPAFNATEKQMYDSIEKTWLKEINRFITKVNKRT